MIKMRKTHLALLVALLLIDVTLQSDKRKRQIDPCPENWHYVSNLRTCYGFTIAKFSWIKAVGICHSVGAKLIEPKSREEMNAIVMLLRAFNIGAVWTGGHSIDTGGNGYPKWQWIDENTPLCDYYAWPLFMPDNYLDNEHCLEIRPEYGYKWNDLNCNVNNIGACQLSRSRYNDTEWT